MERGVQEGDVIIPLLRALTENAAVITAQGVMCQDQTHVRVFRPESDIPHVC